MPKKKTPSREDLHHLGSLITYTDAGRECCLGDLIALQGGVFDPYFGRVDVTPEEAEAHNRLLDEARLKGLDEKCEVGQSGYFYFTNGCVKTFLGTLVTTQVTVKGSVITFWRKGKTFRGRLRRDSEDFNFRRVA